MQYVPGKQLVLADMPSRAPADVPEDASEGNDVEVHAVSMVTVCVSDSTMKRLAEETAKDAYFNAVMERLRHCMPIDGELKPFEYELSVVKGILLKGSKVVIPAAMRRDMLQRIHQGHMGLAKCKARARRFVFWPCINAEIAHLIRAYNDVGDMHTVNQAGLSL